MGRPIHTIKRLKDRLEFSNRNVMLKQKLGEIVVSASPGTPGSHSTSTSHGGFDNDPPTMNSVLGNILGQAPAHPFDKRDLDFD